MHRLTPGRKAVHATDTGPRAELVALPSMPRGSRTHPTSAIQQAKNDSGEHQGACSDGVDEYAVDSALGPTEELGQITGERSPKNHHRADGDRDESLPRLESDPKQAQEGQSEDPAAEDAGGLPLHGQRTARAAVCKPQGSAANSGQTVNRPPTMVDISVSGTRTPRFSGGCLLCLCLH